MARLSTILDGVRGPDVAVVPETEEGWMDPFWRKRHEEDGDKALIMTEGVLHLEGTDSLCKYEEFVADRTTILNIVIQSGAMKSFSYARLKLLEHRFDCYLQLNKAREAEQVMLLFFSFFFFCWLFLVPYC